MTVLGGLILLILLVWQSAVVRVPYVELGPGPTVNTLGEVDGKDVISLSGVPETSSAGQLRLVTVSVQPQINLVQAVRGWLAGDYAVVPRELVYPPDRSEKQVDQQNAQDFKDSQNSAETSALRELGYPVQVTVSKVQDGAPAAGVLQVGDVITSVDGTAVTSTPQLTELIRAKPAGTARTIGYTRAGTASTATVTTAAGDGGAPRIGVEIEPKQPHPFQLSFDLDRIGGPSAGLMFALAIIDKVKPEDLTGGKVIAGTGTIDDAGDVGRIGGIPQKLVGAKAAGAQWFLTPDGNCAEAMANRQPGLPLVKIKTLDDALSALEKIRAGQTPPLC